MHSARGGYHMGGMSKLITTAHMILLLDILQCRSCTFSCLLRLPTKCHSRGIFQSRLPVTILRSTVSISITKVRQMKYNVTYSLTHSHKMNVSNSFVQTLLREQQPVTTGCYDEVLIMQGEAISHMTGQPINVQLPLLCWVLEQL